MGTALRVAIASSPCQGVAARHAEAAGCKRAAWGLRRYLCGWQAQVNLWGLDAIKTKGESVAVALYMVGARPVREGTGRIARSGALHALPQQLTTRPPESVLRGLAQRRAVRATGIAAPAEGSGRPATACRAFAHVPRAHSYMFGRLPANPIHNLGAGCDSPASRMLCAPFLSCALC